MKNREKFAEEILKVACRGLSIAMVKRTNKIVPCAEMINCDDCAFYHGGNCRSNIKNWCESEYNEPEIDIPEDSEVDTKILVSDDGINWSKRHLAKIQNGVVYAWDNGKTSWTATTGTCPWKYGKLEEVKE